MKRSPLTCFVTALFFMNVPFCFSDTTALSIGFAEAARIAIAASDELRNAHSRLDLREGAWAWGLRAYLPRIGISVSEDDRLSTTGPDSFLKNYSVNLDQLIWDGGRISISRNIERAELDAAKTDLARAALDIGESAVAVYREILYFRMALSIRERAAESLAAQYRILERELELGMVLPLDLAAAEITVLQAHMEIRALELELASAEYRLAEILGMDAVPFLSETVDTGACFLRPDPEEIRARAESANPELIAAKTLVERRRMEAEYAGRSWIPAIRITGSAGFSGYQYPLTRFNWNFGLVLEFSSPWFSGSFGGSAGFEGRNDSNARLYGSANPLPDPASGFSEKNAELNYQQEQLNYGLAFRRIGQIAEQTIEKCVLLDRRRALALEALELETERVRLAELNVELGRLTRLELMEAMIARAESEISLVKAAMQVLEAVRELERFLDLPPGGLAVFIAEEEG